jgi:hypothetical protein
MSASTTHAELESRGLTKAPHVSPADLEARIASEHYFTAADAIVNAGIVVGYKYPSPLDLLTICVIVLVNGFTVVGKSACCSPENFDAAMGQKIAREDAIRQLWTLEGYRLRDRLAADHP